MKGYVSMSEKTVQYLFPKQLEASNLKLFQEPGNNILGFYFTRDSIENIKNQPNSGNYAIYFLFDVSDSEITQVYVGQSTKGISRILEHKKSKGFWSYAMMFVTDNNSFDKLMIDYLEYYFINKVKNSNSYNLHNIDERSNEPNISIFDKAKINTVTKQISFLLQCEGVDLSVQTHHEKKKFKQFSAKGDFQASLYVKDGKFYLTAGSEIKRPPEFTKSWKDSIHYNRYHSMIDDFVANGKVKESKDKLVCVVDLEFKAPSTAADLVSGTSQNGWVFFKNLDSLRN